VEWEKQSFAKISMGVKKILYFLLNDQNGYNHFVCDFSNFLQINTLISTLVITLI